MDALSQLLEDIRFRGRMYCRVEAREPWGLSAAPSQTATFHGGLRGQGVLRLAPGGRPITLAAGDLAVITHGDGHAISDSASTALTPIERVVTQRVVYSGRKASLICGAFFSDRRELPPLFSFLPPVLHISAAAMPSGIPVLLELLAAEAEREDGAEASVARLTETLFIQAMRAWTECADPQSSMWVAAMRDPAIGSALQLIHRGPQEDWTVATLARAVALSRSAFAERFQTIVGETPVAYLTRWRIYLVARQLRETPRAVSEIAAVVGYESEASLNKAFKRLMGVPPGAYRRASVRPAS